MFILTRSCAVALGVMSFAGFSYAQDSVQPWEKFSIAVGGFITESDTTLRLNSKTAGVGAVLDLENVLGVEQSLQTYRIDARYRFGETRRHEIELHYFDMQRDGNKTLDQDLQIGDELFLAGTGVLTEFGLRFTNVDYVYNFLMDDRVRLGASVGLHTTAIDFKVRQSGGAQVEEESVTAPLPMVGLRSEVLLTERWRLKMDINVFYIEYDQFTGRLADTLVAIEYIPWKNFGFGAGINSINYDVEADADASIADWNGELEFSLTGLMFYGKYVF